jgi:hypothetical protein
VDNLYSNTDFGLCLLQRLSRRLVAAHPCRALDPRPRSETPHIVNSSIRFEPVIRFSGDPFRALLLQPVLHQEGVAVPPPCAIFRTWRLDAGSSRPDESTAPRSATANSVMNLPRSWRASMYRAYWLEGNRNLSPHRARRERLTRKSERIRKQSLLFRWSLSPVPESIDAAQSPYVSRHMRQARQITRTGA